METKLTHCSVCGKEDGYRNPPKQVNPTTLDPDEFIEGDIKRIMIEKKCCFSCAFWFDKIEKLKNNPRWLIIDGQSYVFNPYNENNYSYFKGFGGRVMYAQKTDGTVLISNDVWHQGEIPEAFKQIIPDNAKFITKEQYKIMDSKKK